MLRALKLVGIHGFTMTPDTIEALREKRGIVQRASISRLYEELLKIFMTGHSLAIFNAFQKDLDRGEYRDSGYFYGPAQPRTVFLGCKISY